MATSTGTTSCFDEALRSLVTDSCMLRTSLADCTDTTAPCLRHLAQLPIYVLHAPHLHARHAFMSQQLASIGANDITWVQCANADDVIRLDSRRKSCLYPCSRSGHPSLTNGTLSLAIKHRIASMDLLTRRLPSAIVLEDDATVPPDLWAQLHRYRGVPLDAAIFYLGSYSYNLRKGVLADHPLAVPAAAGSHVDLWGRSNGSSTVHQRNLSAFPAMLGSIGYIMFAAGARTFLSGPVTGPADTELSLFKQDAGCTDRNGAYHAAAVAPSPIYGPPRWIIWPERTGRLGGGTHVVSDGAHGAQKAGVSLAVKELPALPPESE